MSTTVNLAKIPLFINGEATEPAEERYIPVQNPSTGEAIAKVAVASEGDVDIAVNAAADAFSDPAWRKMPVSERSKLLYKLGHIVLENSQELAELEIASSGGTVSRVMGMDILAIADLFFLLAEEIKVYPFVESLPPRPLPEPVHTQVKREPVGVCGLITAWNFPMLLFSWKVAPALAAGNTVVVKPSELTPSSTYRLAELFNEVLPNGVLNIITGGPETGEALVAHPKVDKVSFTGSTDVGKKIARTAADTLKRVTLELGGKGPAIVFPDADIERVAYGSLFGVLLNAGQACESGTRLLVHEDIHDALVKRMVEVAENIVVGNPTEPSTSVGPMTTEQHYNKVMSYIDSALIDGAYVETGGCRVDVEGCEGGFFIAPTIITNADNSMSHVCEEIFGPVISIIKYRDLDEAVAIANDTAYGLSAGIWSQDVVRAQKVAEDLRAGSVWINDWHMLRTDAPFGGFKQSGYGREMGKYSLDSYTEIKAVATSFEQIPAKKPHYHMVHKTFK